jgi:hypothetical protein
VNPLGDRRCPTCGAQLAGKAICPRCGTLVAAELSLARFQGKARTFFEDRFASLPRRLTPYHFLWACACMPVFLLPPLVSFVFAIVSMRRAGGGQPAGLEWLAIVALINIIISAIILYKFHFSPNELAVYFADHLRALLRSLLPFTPSPSGAPKLTPA